MFERILRRMTEKIRARHYVMSVHADEEMNADDFSIFDVENAILIGEIHERQIDRDTHEWKYRITGRSLDGRKVEVIAKINVADKLVIITVYKI